VLGRGLEFPGSLNADGATRFALVSEAVDGLLIRRADDDDAPAISNLLGAALGWGHDERFAAFFAWKHRDNPQGSSPAWVAVDSAQVVGLRTFLRWDLEAPGGVVRAVRAVDTATHPDHQRRGIFSRLTRQALEELAAEGVELVFNTPNDRSGPGYLKLGWRRLGALPVWCRPSSPKSLARMAGARRAAERWSLPVEAGGPAQEVLADPAVATLVESQPLTTGLRTVRTPAFLAWRYGFAPLHYRAVTVGREPADGIAVFRARRRGRAVEGTVCDVIVPEGDLRLARRALARVAATPGLDYVLSLGRHTSLRAGLVPLPGQGPTLFARPLASPSAPAIDDWDLTLGDVELF
jgi:predicted N-acetyltransferase YhbS